jgi:pyruvate dehydrogenase E2 component (dihydrolipoamide acetyltransferase)
MAEIVKMPKLSDTMTEGVVAKWYKKVGDKVKSGELLADIETDKATMEFESFQTGSLLYIGVETGKAAPVDSILAILGNEGEDIQDIIKNEELRIKNLNIESSKSNVQGSKLENEKKSVNSKQENLLTTHNPQPTTGVKQPTTHNPQPTTNITDNRLKASPLAKALAEEKGIDISMMKGSGDYGRIVKRDIENFKGYSGSYSQAITKESYYEEDVSQMRKTIAKRLAESKFSAPHFYLTMEIDMDQAVEARKQLNETLNEKISFNDIVVKATAVALRKHPKVNSSWQGDPSTGSGQATIRYNEHIHIGVAVAVEDGLLVPVVRFADSKSFVQIGHEVKALAQKAKDKKLQPADWAGNTFTISNLGMFGIEEFTAIINSPDACIMAVGAIRQVAVVKNNMVVPGNVMKVTLSCDHRVVDGASGAAFLQTFKKLLENPILMLI